MSNSTGNTFWLFDWSSNWSWNRILICSSDKGSKPEKNKKDGFDDAKNELKNKLDHASKNLKTTSTAKLDLKKPMKN
jgi:hypothetical protein